MGGWVDEWMGGWMDGWMGGWMGGRVCGQQGVWSKVLSNADNYLPIPKSYFKTLTAEIKTIYITAYEREAFEDRTLNSKTSVKTFELVTPRKKNINCYLYCTV
jgi:hypothetical protein